VHRVHVAEQGQDLGADTVPGWPMTLAAWPAREYPFRM